MPAESLQLGSGCCVANALYGSCQPSGVIFYSGFLCWSWTAARWVIIKGTASSWMQPAWRRDYSKACKHMGRREQASKANRSLWRIYSPKVIPKQQIQLPAILSRKCNTTCPKNTVIMAFIWRSCCMERCSPGCSYSESQHQNFVSD